MAVSKSCNFPTSGCVWVGLTRGSVEKGVICRPWVVVGSGLHVAVSKRVIFRHWVVFGSGLHLTVSKSCNFQASGCVVLGLTRCGVKKL